MSDDSGSVHDLTRITTADDVVLEAEAHLPTDPVAAMVITHPHPTYGGTMHTPIPTTLFQRSEQLGVAALRFNFRSVGRSGGVHDEGRGERLDVAAAVAALRSAVGPDVPLGVGGWSFGADVALGLDQASVDQHRVGGWLAVAAPLSIVPEHELTAAGSPLPKLLLVPELDQFRTPAAAAEATTDWLNVTLVTVAGNDHFLATGLAAVSDGYDRFLAMIRS